MSLQSLMPKNVVIITTAVIALVIVGTGVYLGLSQAPRQGQQAQEGQAMREEQPPTATLPEAPETPSSSPTEASSTPTTNQTEINTSDWVIYRNENAKYEIKHPRDVIIAEESAGTKFSPPAYEGCPPPRGDFAPHECPLFMVIMVQEADPEQSLDDWLTERLARFWAIQQLKEFKITTEENNYGLDCVEKTTIGKGISGWRIHSWSQAWGKWDYYTKNRNRVVTIQTGRIGLSCSNPIDPLFAQMLSTFRFLR